VDELYDRTIVQPIKWLSDHVLWKVVDVWIIDGIVNGVGVFTRGSAALLRMLQSGSVRTYAASLVLGVVLILGYYLMQ
jgi:NADH:ubiquinone oxidoreductase subunit 5 (subunit L)/multisubunit Na+/H+ antiporter MnhA subunit